MECKAEDYYDIPNELLPTPNFAGRPASEISDIGVVDGFWTFPDVSPLFFNADDGDVDSTREARCPEKSSQLHAPTQPEVPEVKVTSPSSNHAHRHTRNWSNVGPAMDMARLQKKASTAPPGATYLPDFAPQPLQRALSVGLGQSQTTRGRSECKKSHVEDFVAIKSALREIRSEPLLHLPSAGKCRIRGQAGGTLQSPSSISEMAREGRMGRNERLAKLDTAVMDYDAESIFGSTISMTNTPQELYGAAEVEITRTQCPRQPSRRNFLMRVSPETSLVPQQHTRSQRLDAQGLETLQHDDDVASTGTREQGRLYLPGPVVLEKHAVLARKASVATMDLFDSGLESRAKRFSDLTTTDGIVSFFADLGVTENSPDDCLDRYWLDERPGQRASAWSRRTSIVSIIEPVLGGPLSPLSPLSPESAQSGRQTRNITRMPSKFSLSSASSSASLPRPGTPMGKRLKWIRLLTPGLPGSAFLKSAGS